MTRATFKVWRTDPAGGHYSSYTVDVVPGMVVLDAIHQIQAALMAIVRSLSESTANARNEADALAYELGLEQQRRLKLEQTLASSTNGQRSSRWRRSLH